MCGMKWIDVLSCYLNGRPASLYAMNTANLGMSSQLVVNMSWDVPLSEAAKYTNPSTTAFPRRFSCDGAARPPVTPSRQRRAGINEDTAETSVLRGLAKLNRLILIWLTRSGRVEPCITCSIVRLFIYLCLAACLAGCTVIYLLACLPAWYVCFVLLVIWLSSLVVWHGCLGLPAWLPACLVSWLVYFACLPACFP